MLQILCFSTFLTFFLLLYFIIPLQSFLIKAKEILGNRFYMFLESRTHFQCIWVFEVKGFFIFTFLVMCLSFNLASMRYLISLWKICPTGYLYRSKFLIGSLVPETNILYQNLTHGHSRLWLCQGHRWTRKRTDGAGGPQVWLAVGGWPVRPYHRTPSAPVPPLPACPSAPCGRLCLVQDAHPGRQKQISVNTTSTFLLTKLHRC